MDTIGGLYIIGVFIGIWVVIINQDPHTRLWKFTAIFLLGWIPVLLVNHVPGFLGTRVPIWVWIVAPFVGPLIYALVTRPWMDRNQNHDGQAQVHA